jgi:replicative DNA helicase
MPLIATDVWCSVGDRSPFEDPSAEAQCIAGVVRHGRDAYVDCEGYFVADDLKDEMHQVIWACAEHIYADGDDRPLDYATVRGAARKLSMEGVVNQTDFKEYFASLKKVPIELESVKHEAARLLKFKVGRELYRRLRSSGKSLQQMTGDESLGEIISLVESPIFDYTANLGGDRNETKQIGAGVEEWLENVLTNPCENPGVPSPWARFNELIGGGFLRKAIAMVAARAKAGKSVFADNVALFVAGVLGIPVFNLDTEMSDEQHWARILAHLTGIDSKRIRRGKTSREEADRLREKAAWLKSIPYYYRSVIGEDFEEQISAMRRWIIKDVGVRPDGYRNDCLIIYDYLQLTDPREFGGGNSKFAEYQILGFQMVALSMMVKKFDVPLLSLLQLNREGQASGSDRIVWKCSSFSTLTRMEEAEVEKYGYGKKSVWLSVTHSRDGEGSEGRNDDIAIIFDGATARMTEGPTRRELDGKRVESTKKGFEVDNPEEDYNLGYDEEGWPEGGSLAKLGRS